MPAVLSTPEITTIRLKRLDERMSIVDDDPTTVTIRQATTRQNQKRSLLFNEVVKELTHEGLERTIYHLPLYTLMEEEVYLTMVGCNLMKNNGTADQPKLVPLFKFAKSDKGHEYLNMSRKEFAEAWGLLDDGTAAEIYEKVLEVNPHWMMVVGDLSLGEDS
jgi:hypothetical protein